MRLLFSLLPVVAFVFNALPAHALTMEEAMEKYKVKEAIQNMEKERRSQVARGQLISVDTRDQESCAKVKQSIADLPNLSLGEQNLEDLCKQDRERPFASVMVFQNVNGEEFRKEIDLSPLTNNEKNLTNDTRNMAFAMAGFMGILWAMPESFTKWDKKAISESKSGIFVQYADNIKKGPVIDKDAWAVNFIGHPVSGAAYYTMARHSGLSRMESFGYSVLMSTFFWEYGFEALAEVPSIQDLILTPVMGALLGELFYTWEMKIKENGGTLLGSKKLGSIAMVMLNPMDNLSNGINRMLGARFIQDAKASVVTRRRPLNYGLPSIGPEHNDTYIGLEIKFSF